jgi:hypothetical protein
MDNTYVEHDKETPALRSSHQKVLDWWDQYLDDHHSWHERCNKLAEEIAPFEGAQALTLDGFSTIFGGYRAPSGASKYEGWRLDKKHWRLVPHRSTPTGKAIAAKIKELGPLRDPRMSIPGVPTDLISLPGLAKYGNEVWLEFNYPRKSYNPELWTPAPLSQYHIAREAHEAANPDEKPLVI